MASQRQSPTNMRYIISLKPPQGIVSASGNLAAGLASSGAVTAPMAPMLPLLETLETPRPPVTGTLPPCRSPLVPAERPVRDTDSPWWLWPVDSGGWFADLAKALETHSSPGPVTLLYPLCRGIPLAAVPCSVAETEDIGDTGWDTPDLSILRWRALNLECYEIVFDNTQEWYLDLRWRTLWKRRLRRAPISTNNNK